MSDQKPFSGRVAIVTGGTRGIGRAIVLELANRGADVAFNYAKSAEAAESIKSQLESLGVRALSVKCDVASTEAAAEMVKQVKDTFGRIDFLVNNAGITRDNLALRMKDAEWDEVIDTNLRAIFRLSRAVMRGMMKARWGRIINITSVVGASGNPGQANYAAAKAGVVGMTKSLARELGSRNITVNCVAPGFIDTDMTRALSEDNRKALLEQIPLGRLGTPQDVAAAVAYLVSPGGGYVTGAVLHVNGGMYMA